MSKIKCCYINILESSLVSLLAGTEDPAYPLYRLYDRDIGKFFMSNATTLLEVKIDQLGSGPYIDRLLIPSGHNLNGKTLDILYSSNDVTYYPAVAQWVQSDSGIIDKSWTALERRWWKFRITSGSAQHYFAELFLTSTYTWETNPSFPAKPLDPEPNVKRIVNARKQPRYLVLGDPVRQRGYRVVNKDETQRANIEALNAVWAGHMPFWVYDHEGILFYVELSDRINLEKTSHNNYAYDFNISEIII